MKDQKRRQRGLLDGRSHHPEPVPVELNERAARDRRAAEEILRDRALLADLAEDAGVVFDRLCFLGCDRYRRGVVRSLTIGTRRVSAACWCHRWRAPYPSRGVSAEAIEIDRVLSLRHRCYDRERLATDGRYRRTICASILAPNHACIERESCGCTNAILDLRGVGVVATHVLSRFVFPDICSLSWLRRVK